jgi:hypothetical protein
MAITTRMLAGSLTFPLVTAVEAQHAQLAYIAECLGGRAAAWDSLDHLVGAGEQCRGDFEAQGISGRQRL